MPSKQYYAKHRERILKQKNKYYMENREEIRKKEKQRRIENPGLDLYQDAKRRAKKRNIEFNIELEDIVIPNVCPILQIPLYRGEGVVCNNSPSIDRIDPEKGYTKGNISIISWRANKIKHNATKEELIKIVEYIAEHERLI